MSIERRAPSTRATLRMRGQDLSKRRHAEAAGLAKGCDVSAYYTFKACICTVAWAESCIRLPPPSPSAAFPLPAWSLSFPPSVRAFRYIRHTTAIAEDPTKRSTTAHRDSSFPRHFHFSFCRRPSYRHPAPPSLSLNCFLTFPSREERSNRKSLPRFASD